MAVTSDLIQKAGGENILVDLKKTWVRSVSWESVIEKDPEWIVLFDYDDAENKIKFFKEHPKLKDISAVKNNKFISFHYPDLVPGARVTEVIEKMAKSFYPKAFEVE